MKSRWFTYTDGKKGDLVDTAHIVLRLKNRTDVGKFNFGSVNAPGIRVVRNRLAGEYYEVQVPARSNALEILDTLYRSGQFDFASFNVLVRVDATPNDPRYNDQWNLPKVAAPSAWDFTTGTNTVKVAVVDVGGDYNHEDLAANKWSGTGYDFYDGDSDPYPYDGAGHGTCVAGIIAAATNNSTGVAGLAGGWGGSGGIRLMHMRAGYYDSFYGGLIDLDAATQAVDSAAVWGAKVINMSFGGGAYAPLESAINNAVNNYGVVVVASAGNYESGGSTSIEYPAAYSDVIAVGASTESDARKSVNDNTDEAWWGSCYGSQLWMVAPGIHISTTDITGNAGYDDGEYYSYFNGTSSAAPHIAATAALLFSVNPSLTPAQVRGCLRYSADKVTGMSGNDWTSEYGYGRLNTNTAVHNVYVPGECSTLASALSIAVAGQTVMVSGSQTVTGYLTVNSGVTLQMNAGSSLAYNSANTRLLVYGTLNVNGTSGSHVTINGQGYTRTGAAMATVVVASGGTANIQYADFTNAAYELSFWSCTGSVTAQHCTFASFSTGQAMTFQNKSSGTATISSNTFTGTSQQGTGIYCYNTGTNVTLSSNSISNAGTGIRLYNSNAMVTSNSLTSNAGYGIQADYVGTSARYRSNWIRENGYGISMNAAAPYLDANNIFQNGLNVLVNSCSPYFATLPGEGDGQHGHNTIAHGADPLLRVQYSSFPYMGYDVDGGYNSIYDSPLPDVRVTNSSGLYADNNYWTDSWPSCWVDGTSWALTDNDLDDNPNPDPLGKRGLLASAEGPSSPFVEPVDSTGEARIAIAISAAMTGDVQRATTTLNELIASGSARFGPLALIVYHDLATSNKIPVGQLAEVKADVDGLLQSLRSEVPASSLKPFALHLLARDAALAGQLEVANAYRMELLRDCPESATELPTLYDLVVFSVESAGDLTKAKELVAQMVESYPDANLTYMARIEVGESVTLPEAPKKGPVATPSRNAEFALDAAYPSPFNPTTSIGYHLKDVSFVTLRIYDLLGRQVAELVNAIQTAGAHFAVWNARGMSSGVYIYRLEASNTSGKILFSQTRRMLLMK